MKLFLLLLCLMIPYSSFILKGRILAKYSYTLSAFNPAQTYFYGDIVGENDEQKDVRSFCFDKSSCSGAANAPNLSAGWKALSENQAVDLSMDNYKKNTPYTNGAEIIYHQMTWICSAAEKCSSDDYNPVGIFGKLGWTKVRDNPSLIPEETTPDEE